MIGYQKRVKGSSLNLSLNRSSKGTSGQTRLALKGLAEASSASCLLIFNLLFKILIRFQLSQTLNTKNTLSKTYYLSKTCVSKESAVNL